MAGIMVDLAVVVSSSAGVLIITPGASKEKRPARVERFGRARGDH
jgi:hypothetical protein